MDTPERKDVAANPFGSTAVTARAAGSLISVEQQRAIAEVQAAMIVARSNPRDPAYATELILQDCTRPALAEAAVYEYSRGGTDITGPSIRLIETIARRWGNIDCGVRELSRHDGFSECVAYAVDIETNFRDSKTFQVKHWRDTKTGGYQITDERDIYEIVANMGARRKRACLIAIIPGDVVEAAVSQCEKTLKVKVVVTPELIAEMLGMFADYGVTKPMIEKRIQRHIDSITPTQVVQLKKIHNSLKDGMSTAVEWFEPTDVAAAESKPATGTEKLKQAAKAKGAGTKKDAGAPPDDDQGNQQGTQPQAQQQGGTTNGSLDLDDKGKPGESVLDKVKRICADAVKIKDRDTAYLRLDDARLEIPGMEADAKKLAAEEIDKAMAAIKARES